MIGWVSWNSQGLIDGHLRSFLKADCELGGCWQVTQPAGAPKARSSHAVAIVGKKAYVFGGEFEPECH